MRRHVGRDHARALGDAVDDHLGVAELDARGRDLRIGVGGHDRLGGAEQRVGAGVRDQRADDARDPRPVERLADDAGRSHEDFVGRRADRLGGGLRDMGDRGRADAAGEGVGVAGIDDERARLPLVQMRAAPVDRRRGAFGAGEHARDRRRPVEQRHHDVGPPGIANARGDRRKADAGDRRQGGIGLRRQRRERSGSGHETFPKARTRAGGEPALAKANPARQGVFGLSAAAGAAAAASLPGSAAWASGGSGLPSASNSSILAALWSCEIASLSAFWAT